MNTASKFIENRLTFRYLRNLRDCFLVGAYSKSSVQVNVPIVGIGAAAGCLEALQELFKHLTPEHKTWLWNLD